jgi:hypothetical protein
VVRLAVTAAGRIAISRRPLSEVTASQS